LPFSSRCTISAEQFAPEQIDQGWARLAIPEGKGLHHPVDFRLTHATELLGKGEQQHLGQQAILNADKWNAR